MKASLIYIESSREDFAIKALELYTEKIKRFCNFETIKLKSPSLARDNKELKIKEEFKLIQSKIKDNDFLVLLDERGKQLSSRELAKKLSMWVEGPKRVVFIIGGAFGIAEDLKKKAHVTISLSQMVMNHHIAMVVLLEQIYRSFTIIKNIPYHND